jgi:hypothetical protein
MLNLFETKGFVVVLYLTLQNMFKNILIKRVYVPERQNDALIHGSILQMLKQQD